VIQDRYSTWVVRAAFLWAGLVASGCIDRPSYHCSSASQCTIDGEQGFCETTGFCSLADPACPGGRRYADGAGALSGQCVDGELPVDGGPDSGDDVDASADAAPVDAAPVDGPPPDVAILEDYTPTNFGAELLTAGTAALHLQASDGVVLVDTAAGTIRRQSDSADLRPAGVGFETVVQGLGAPSIGVFTVSGLVVEAGVEVRVSGAPALAFAVAGDATLAGTFDLRGRSASPQVLGIGGPGGGDGGVNLTSSAAGPCGGGGVDLLGDVGGGGGGHGINGGAGGARGVQPGGSAGRLCGNAVLEPLRGGGGGGAGGGGATRGRGGGGGGALQISARGIVTQPAEGVINVSGGGGGGGGNDDGGGGGGAGGGVLLEGARLVLDGLIVANGGGGGAGADMTTPGPNGTGGLASSAQASGGTGSGEGKSGGQGGAGTMPEGLPGTGSTGTTGSDNAGGGGGAAGRIRLRSDDIRRGGTTSPSGLTTEAPL
jgi:hypothetical protein